MIWLVYAAAATTLCYSTITLSFLVDRLHKVYSAPSWRRSPEMRSTILAADCILVLIQACVIITALFALTF